MRRAKKQEKPEEEKVEIFIPTDCTTCTKHITWKYNLIYCKHRIVPAPNCNKNRIKCVNYESIK